MVVMIPEETYLEGLWPKTIRQERNTISPEIYSHRNYILNYNADTLLIMYQYILNILTLQFFH
jgi:hypothetical protein